MTGMSLTIEILRRFSPLDSLKRENIAALAKKMQSHRLEGGQLLFKEGDSERRTFYLLSGTLQLSQRDGNLKTLRAGSEEARSPVSPMLPRRWEAKAVDDVRYLAIDTDLLDVMLTWDQTGSYEVSDLNSTQTAAAPDDWMTALLQTKAFHRVPPANIQAIFMRMQRVDYKAGEVVIRQGDAGDYFYVISSGRCNVIRETPLNKGGIKLAELGVGDTFGEEALISETHRNATVSMLSDGSLMRLGKEDFLNLLNEPLLDKVDYAEAQRVVAAGAKWLDVRLPSEFESFHETGAINIPLYFIRLKLATLDPTLTYVVCCDTGRRSSAGAFILNEHGFDTRVLRDGLNVRS
ncbi:MAG: cyclic nucleotide-binding domain-containing protein [Gammaproteobacteria bacterium]|nr:cyclic nucleotide-binding domain-containing protein [Gammaproteobacteria bacterium]